MSRTRIVKGKITERVKGDISIYSASNIIETSLQSIVEIGKEKGISFGQPKRPPSIETTEVERIEIEKLKEGSANDGTGKSIRLGLVYGEKYKLRVTKFKNNEEPISSMSIKWLVSYITEEGEVAFINISQRGKEILYKADALKACGRDIKFYAYIKDRTKGGELMVFQHYRFRWFDREIIKEELKERAKEYWLIDQNSTSLCGMACLFYLLIKEKPDIYYKYVLALHQYGEVKYNNYITKPNDILFSKNPNEKGYPYIIEFGEKKEMPLCDYITLGGLRNTENSFYKGGDEEFAAINWPNLMVRLCEDFLGYEEVDSKGIHLPIKKSKDYDKDKAWKIVEDINNQISQGYKLILLIDSDMISYSDDSKDPLFAFEYHWVVLEEPIKLKKTFRRMKDFSFILDNIFTLLDFKVYSWGTRWKYPMIPITIEHFINNYYGYIKVK